MRERATFQSVPLPVGGDIISLRRLDVRCAGQRRTIGDTQLATIESARTMTLEGLGEGAR